MFSYCLHGKYMRASSHNQHTNIAFFQWLSLVWHWSCLPLKICLAICPCNLLLLFDGNVQCVCEPIFLNLPDEFKKITANNIVVRIIFLETQDIQHASVLGTTRNRTASLTIGMLSIYCRTPRHFTTTIPF